MSTIREDADTIIKKTIKAALPDSAVKKALSQIQFKGKRLFLLAIGKAAWQMAETAHSCLGDKIIKGFVITKYEHSKGPIGNFEIFEAGHPVSDKNTYFATGKVLDFFSTLEQTDDVIFLISGGGSSLFEKPIISEEDWENVNKQLLACGADIVEINTIRKRLSSVKGGKFAQCCNKAHIYTVVLSDIIGDPLDMIASGPAYPDSSTSKQALDIVTKYNLKLSENVMTLLQKETAKELANVETFVTGSVKQLCITAEEVCKELGYEPVILTSSLTCEAKDAGKMLSSLAKENLNTKKSLAFLAGGETVVHLTGNGKGGRNQEIALSASEEISNLKDTCVFSFGSDGTDGPTDAAGGYVDGNSFGTMQNLNINVASVLRNNDAYNALNRCNGLIMTGPTGTNVNDLSVLLIKR